RPRALSGPVTTGASKIAPTIHPAISDRPLPHRASPVDGSRSNQLIASKQPPKTIVLRASPRGRSKARRSAAARIKPVTRTAGRRRQATCPQVARARHDIVEESPGGAESRQGLFGGVASELAPVSAREAGVDSPPGVVQRFWIEALRRTIRREDADRVGAEHGAEVGNTLGHGRTDQGVDAQA